MNTIRKLAATLSAHIRIKIERRKIARAIQINQETFLYKRHEGSPYYGFEYRLPDGTVEQYWRPAKTVANYDDFMHTRARAAIARREVRTSEPWHLTVPFDRRSWNPYSPQSHR